MKIIYYINENLEKGLLILTLGLMSAFIIIQVVMRYVFQSSLAWSEEFIRWLFVWFIWIGISYGFKLKKHVSIPLIVDLFPDKIRKGIAIFTQLSMAVFFIFLCYYSYKQATSPLVLRQSSVVLAWPIDKQNVSMFWLYASMPLGALLSSFRLFQNAVLDIGRFNKH
ncbi:hypothetical protein SOASR030_08900 [Leminorella grimontii]|uniref:TRAP transporter small permease protein n=1 Tax=Leminorella grimontii TaxID=82981 RepID=A0AAV5MY46_9GAMM|nr:TRAP transporter small permease [Leminorella grimontii]KFC96040.1 small permease component of a TRAP-type C4-dicarboxylate transporter [Leminorella grimontii ATCC 33999 = DSM 5078]GKX54778.1 hypothetical protein SOASR030_08900 [Leminorella grimontii]GKX58196.1 hypothetical protein SOASR031_05110 [Leminorella grimontii]VFS58455.1 Neu5Ac permease [Leminorella grimontii]